MRTIKFRIWNKTKNRFEPSNYQNECYIGSVEGNIARIQDHDSWNHPNAFYYNDKDNFVIQQYTGMKDLKGKEIYEGDIVYLSYANFSEEYNKLNLYVVGFSHGSFTIQIEKMDNPKQGTRAAPVLRYINGFDKEGNEIWEYHKPLPVSVYDFNILTVIGNIYETPDLLN